MSVRSGIISASAWGSKTKKLSDTPVLTFNIMIFNQ